MVNCVEKRKAEEYPLDMSLQDIVNSSIHSKLDRRIVKNVDVNGEEAVSIIDKMKKAHLENQRKLKRHYTNQNKLTLEEEPETKNRLI